MFFSLLAALIALLAGVIDARTGRIPNWLTLGALGGGLVGWGVVGGTSGLAFPLFGSLVCGFVPYALYRATRGQAIGGGDVKLFAALGALLGPRVGLEAQMLGFLSLALGALLLLAWRGELIAVLWSTVRLATGWMLPPRWRRPPSEAALTTMRMGPAIALGTCLVLALELAP